MKKIISAAMMAVISTGSATAAQNSTKCHDLTWKMAERNGHWVKLRGHVRPGTRRIDIELRNSSKIIGQTITFPNLGGNWQATIRADYVVKRSHKPKFYCSQ